MAVDPERRREQFRENERRRRARARGEDVPLLIAPKVPIEHTCPPGSDRNDCACIRARQDERRRGGRNRAGNLRRYGLTLAQYDALRAAQDYRCAACGRHEEDVRWGPDNRGLVVDHCHTEGRVRALLCTQCNTGIGMFGDDPDRMIAAAEWLRAQLLTGLDSTSAV